MFEAHELLQVLPEMLVAGMACLILVVDLFLSDQRRGLIHLMALLTLVFAAILTLRPNHELEGAARMVLLNDNFVRDNLGDLLKIFVYLITGVVLVYAKHYLRQWKVFRGEFYVLVLTAVLGMMVMISAASLITLYLGLELLALSSYALVAMHKDIGLAPEAATKYFVLGALASGILLYGMSMIYGAAGSLALSDISATVTRLGPDDLILTFGLVFVVVGIAFKLGAVPFHMWLPDVYQGAPAPVTLFIGSVPKLAAVAMVIRLLGDGMPGLQEHWGGMLVILAVASLALGNVVAIAQTNIKRMLAYSTISHVGFILIALLSGSAEGQAAALFYVMIYSIMAAGAFGVIILLSRAGKEAELLHDFKGLNRRNSWAAFLMACLMASMAGIPPFIGFFAKLLVLKAAISAGYLWLAILAVIFAVIGSFYYLRVIKLMYFDDPEEDAVIEASPDLQAVLSVNALAQLGLAVFFGPLLALCLLATGA